MVNSFTDDLVSEEKRMLIAIIILISVLILLVVVAFSILIMVHVRKRTYIPQQDSLPNGSKS